VHIHAVNKYCRMKVPLSDVIRYNQKPAERAKNRLPTDIVMFLENITEKTYNNF